MYTQNALMRKYGVAAGLPTKWKQKGLIAPDIANEKGEVVLYSEAQAAVFAKLAAAVHANKKNKVGIPADNLFEVPDVPNIAAVADVDDAPESICAVVPTSLKSDSVARAG